ncbi:MAG TPA: aminodeoxychorismate/anthranilate synthase component II [Marmoricola sp.]|nr:aminodeoxychorismate/anthranilate synthase component II [Marmoricola sp.]
MSAPRLVVVDHFDSYTWNLVHLIAGVTGVLPEVMEHNAVQVEELSSYDGVVLSPGPGHPASMTDFALGADVFGLGLPVLGVCLGMQAMVSHLGGVVERIEPAHGEVDRISHDGRGVFAGLPEGLRAVRYHSLAATSVPNVLEVSATAEGGVVMGVRHRSLPLEGVQFHPESILSEYGAEMIANFVGTI